MAQSIPERDWKYMKKIHDDLLATLCDHINKQSSAVLAESGVSEYEKHLKLYKHVKDSDYIVALCFNDWRRSTLFMKILEIKHQGLITPIQLQGLSMETQERLKGLEQHL